MTTLAAAYAEVRQFPQAVAAAQRAVALATSSGNRMLALKCQAELELSVPASRAGRSR